MGETEITAVRYYVDKITDPSGELRLPEHITVCLETPALWFDKVMKIPTDTDRISDDERAFLLLLLKTGRLQRHKYECRYAWQRCSPSIFTEAHYDSDDLDELLSELKKCVQKYK